MQTPTPVNTEPTSTAVIPTPVTGTTMTVNYFVPKDITKYMSAEELYSQDKQGTDPALTVAYDKDTTTTASTEDPMRTAVQAALSILPAGGGPPHANVVYLKVDGISAYVMLDIDFNGWAGVSAVEAALHPVITKNLMQFSAIKYVVFGPAPGDTREKIQGSLNLQY